MYGQAAIHTPTPARREDAKRLLHEVCDTVLRGAPGLLAAYLGEDTNATQVFAFTIWETREDFEAVLPSIVEEIGKTDLHSWAVSPARVIRFQELAPDD